VSLCEFFDIILEQESFAIAKITTRCALQQ